MLYVSVIIETSFWWHPLQYWEYPPGRWLEDASDILKEQGLEEA